MVKFSIVVPIHDEEKAIPLLYASLKEVMDGLGHSYEIIFINDGSTDGSLGVLKELNLKESNLVVVNLSRRNGQSTALQAGFDIAKGELIITMDGDLQNDPADISALLDKMEDGFDVVCGWRHDRKDPWIKLSSSRIANIIRRTITKEKIHDVGCTLRVFRKECLNDICLYGSMHRFFTLILAKLGYKVGEVKIRHYPRIYGRTKYNTRNRLLTGSFYFILVLLFDMSIVMKRGQHYDIRDLIRCKA